MKLIPNFENYSISPQGVVINVITGQHKKPCDNHSGHGYLYVDLYNNGKRKRCYLHRLVAQAYLPNPDGKQFINHIDGNPKNNSIDNLEWCTPKENVAHAALMLGVMKQYQLANQKRKKAVACFDAKSGRYICSYSSINEAKSKTGIPTSNIVAQLKGRQSHTRGMVWCYVEELEG